MDFNNYLVLKDVDYGYINYLCIINLSHLSYCEHNFFVL